MLEAGESNVWDGLRHGVALCLSYGGRVPQGNLLLSWNQGLMGMQVGGKRKLWVPAHLGYGERQVGSIPSNSNLVFEIELLEVLTRDD
ncbi:MAG: hypothetical protein E6Q69_16725 [Aquipseudomonas alcaligenes]|uniref:Peptidyl-prolyl cis-trans isomerase n=1 Tax=Aquipseudomonas alcaligenes TaxID=43263 RepID=A0A5C7VSL4_AQUAC|nr:MAG: hypothetical protein E6Q69_16725 [Pseudomonas alcaligenes]